jgi:outer membrane lipopolysaccharide assembly protein LptE/RlpB
MVNMTGACLKAAALLCCLWMIGACGYSFIQQGESIGKNVQKIFVDVFANKTSEANIENTFRTAFADQIIQGRRFKLASSPDEADAILKGSVESLSAAPMSYQATNLAAEDRMTIVLSLTLEARDPQKILWANSSFSGFQDYTMNNDIAIARTNKNNALTKLAQDTAERAYRLMMSDF